MRAFAHQARACGRVFAEFFPEGIEQLRDFVFVLALGLIEKLKLLRAVRVQVRHVHADETNFFAFTHQHRVIRVAAQRLPARLGEKAFNSVGTRKLSCKA